MNSREKRSLKLSLFSPVIRDRNFAITQKRNDPGSEPHPVAPARLWPVTAEIIGKRACNAAQLNLGVFGINADPSTDIRPVLIANGRDNLAVETDRRAVVAMLNVEGMP